MFSNCAHKNAAITSEGKKEEPKKDSDDKKQESVIRIGDMVKMKYSKSAMKSFAKMAKNMTK